MHSVKIRNCPQIKQIKQIDTDFANGYLCKSAKYV